MATLPDAVVLHGAALTIASMAALMGSGATTQ